jgi:hypothetical protein
MAEYSKIMEGYFTVPASLRFFLNLPAIPDTIEMWNKTTWGTAPAGATAPQYAIGFAEDPAGTYYDTTAVASSSSAALSGGRGSTGGFSFVSAGTYAYGPSLTITAITQANPAVVTSAAHGLKTGDSVLITQTTGMLQIAGVVYTVTVIDVNTFSINVDSSGFAAPATAGFAKRLLYPDLYIPEGTSITGVTTGVTTTIQTALVHSFVPGNEIFFVVSPPWGMTQLDSLGVLTNTGIPQQAYVISTTAQSITVNVNSTGYTAFAYPTSASYATNHVTPAQALSAGDQNTGFSGFPPIPPPITIPGAYVPNTRQGVLFGGTIIPVAGNVIRWRAIYPDLLKTF